MLIFDAVKHWLRGRLHDIVRREVVKQLTDHQDELLGLRSAIGTLGGRVLMLEKKHMVSRGGTYDIHWKR